MTCFTWSSNRGGRGGGNAPSRRRGTLQAIHVVMEQGFARVAAAEDVVAGHRVDRALEADHFRGLRGGQRELPGETA